MRPSRVEAHARARDVVARLRIGDQRFRARGGPFHRTPEPPRGPHDGRHLDREIALEPEAAADVRRHHADFVLGDVQRVDREPAPQVVRHLRGGIERREVGRRVVVAEIGARLHRAAGEPLVREVELDDLAPPTPAPLRSSPCCPSRSRTRDCCRSARARAARRARPPRRGRRPRAAPRSRRRPLPRRRARRRDPPRSPRRPHRRHGARGRARRQAAAPRSSAGRRRTAWGARPSARRGRPPSSRRR